MKRPSDDILKAIFQVAGILAIVGLIALGCTAMQNEINVKKAKDKTLGGWLLVDMQTHFNCIEASLGKETSVYIETYEAFLKFAIQSEANPVFYQSVDIDFLMSQRFSLDLWFIHEGVVYIWRMP